MVDPTPNAGDLMTRTPVTVSRDATVARALALMQARQLHEIPVLRAGRLIGMITLDTIAHRTNLSLSTKVESLLTLPPRLSPSMGWEEVARSLLLSGLRALPVVDRRDRLLGIVSRTDIIRVLPAVSRLSDAAVDEVMSPLGTLVGEREGIGRLINTVRDEAPVAVVDKGRRLVGSIGLADLGRAFWRPMTRGKGDRPRERDGHGTVSEIEARSIMRSPAVQVASGTPVREAARRMGEVGISSVFVVRDGFPAGAVTQVDLLELAVGGQPSRHPRHDVFYRLHGFTVADAPSIVADIDHAVREGLSRIGRRVAPVLLDLHVHPEGVHRSGNVTVTGRLHTALGIVRAQDSGWDPRVGTARVLDELEEQTRRLIDRRRRPSRARRAVRRMQRGGRPGRRVAPRRYRKDSSSDASLLPSQALDEEVA